MNRPRMTQRSLLGAALLLALGAGLLAALPAPADAQLPRPAAKSPRAHAEAVARALHGIEAVRGRQLAPQVLRAPTATGTETEPNDSLSIADSVSVGDTISGATDPSGDVDWFGFDVTADTTIVLDVNASRSGSSLDAVLYLFSVDTLLAANDDYNGSSDSHIEYHVTAGRYYAALVDYYGAGGASYYYALSFSLQTPPPLGPGDSTRLYASGLGAPYGFAAGPAGEIYATDAEGRRLLRVNPGGTFSQVTSLPAVYPLRPVLDGFGNVLVTVLDTGLTFAAVERITPGGSVSTFASGFSWAAGITVGPDGDVWVLSNLKPTAWLRRYDPVGARKDSIDITWTLSQGFFYTASSLAFSPGGVLHFSNGYDRIYKVVNRVPQPVIFAAPYMESLAFDRDGYLYVSNGSGWVTLYDPAYAVVSDSFARTNLASGFAMSVMFGRDGSGAMTSRLFATNAQLGAIYEMNPAGMRAPGFRVGVDLLVISPAALAAGTMGADYSVTLAVQSPPGAPTWSIASGALPGGLTLATATGVLSGVPEASGTFTFTVRADAGGRQGFQAFTLTVNQPDVSITAAANHLLAGDQMDAALQRFLDFQGNHNGRYDVGDFRAYLRAQGHLPAAISARKGAP